MSNLLSFIFKWVKKKFKGHPNFLFFSFGCIFWGGRGGREGRRTNERTGTDHVTSVPKRGLKKLHSMAETEGHGNNMTELVQWGQFSEKKW